MWSAINFDPLMSLWQLSYFEPVRVGGWTLIVCGIWLHVRRESLTLWPLFVDNETRPVVIVDQLPVALVLLGLLFAIMSFLGCCGTCVDSVCFLGFYSLFLVCVVATEITVGLLMTALRDQVSSSLLSSMHYQVQREYNRTAKAANVTADDTLRITAAWDALQTKMHCCGVEGPGDYLHSSWFNHSRDLDGIFVPPSCCALVQRHQSFAINENFCQVAAILYPKSLNESNFLHTQGCHKALFGWSDDYLESIVFPLSLLVFLQVAALILTCALLRWVRLKQSDYWWYVTEECD